MGETYVATKFEAGEGRVSVEHAIIPEKKKGAHTVLMQRSNRLVLHNVVRRMLFAFE